MFCKKSSKADCSPQHRPSSASESAHPDDAVRGWHRWRGVVCVGHDDREISIDSRRQKRAISPNVLFPFLSPYPPFGCVSAPLVPLVPSVA